MENEALKRTEKRLARIFLLLGVIAVVGVVLLIRFGGKRPAGQPDNNALQETSPEDTAEAGLSDETFWMPQNCSLYDTIPDISFEDAQGSSHSITEWRGKPAVVMFWASWCPDCREQMAGMKAYRELAKQYGEISFVFINKTDGEKETLDTAKEYFDGLGLLEESYYDRSLQAHGMVGIHNIPTTLFLDADGRIAAWSAEQITEQGVFEALLQILTEGNAGVTAAFVRDQMTDASGGIHSDYRPGKEADTEGQVLSESQGLMLLYASIAKDKSVFDSTLSYIRKYMWQPGTAEGLTAWKVEDGQASRVNALIDDFRIYRGLTEAQKLWGGYEEDIRACGEALLSYGMENRRYVDFYDGESAQHASRFTLCYGDLEAMEQLAGLSEEYREAGEAAQALVRQGQISSAFPLYYSWYNYDRKRYEKDDLNAAEAMITLLHLARQGQLENNSLQWLKEQMAGEGIKARYTVEGKAVPGYEYDSTAVYAIVAMIADEVQDTTLRGLALKKMEKMHIHDTAKEYNGAFGLEDGTGITSFDQLMPMIAYACLENLEE